MTAHRVRALFFELAAMWEAGAADADRRGTGDDGVERAGADRAGAPSSMRRSGMRSRVRSTWRSSRSRAKKMIMQALGGRAPAETYSCSPSSPSSSLYSLSFLSRLRRPLGVMPRSFAA